MDTLRNRLTNLVEQKKNVSVTLNELKNSIDINENKLLFETLIRDNKQPKESITSELGKENFARQNTVENPYSTP